jgi:nuclear GTP-binding protein
MQRIFLIDSPGVVYQSEDTPTDIILKSVVRVENLDDVSQYIPEVLNRIKKEYLQRHYKVVEWKDHIDFLTQIAKKTGKLLKNNVPDIQTVAKRLLYDWQRGRIPWY